MAVHFRGEAESAFAFFRMLSVKEERTFSVLRGGNILHILFYILLYLITPFSGAVGLLKDNSLICFHWLLSSVKYPAAEKA